MSLSNVIPVWVIEIEMLQKRVEELEADARAMFPKEPYPAQPHGKGCPGCTCGLDARQAATIAALQRHLDDDVSDSEAAIRDIGIERDLRLDAEARERVLRAALERIAASPSCGCYPRHQCHTQEALQIELDAIRDIARAALSEEGKP